MKLPFQQVSLFANIIRTPTANDEIHSNHSKQVTGR